MYLGFEFYTLLMTKHIILKTVLGFLLLFIFVSCNKAEKAFIGTWEFDYYTIEDSGLGAFKDFIPEEWTSAIDEWIEKTKGLTNSVLVFYPDLTYKESFSGAVDGLTAVKGTFSVTPDFSELRLMTSEKELVLPLIEVEEDKFIYAKSLKKYSIPLTIHLVYRRVE